MIQSTKLLKIHNNAYIFSKRNWLKKTETQLHGLTWRGATQRSGRMYKHTQLRIILVKHNPIGHLVHERRASFDNAVWPALATKASEAPWSLILLTGLNELKLLKIG